VVRVSRTTYSLGLTHPALVIGEYGQSRLNELLNQRRFICKTTLLSTAMHPDERGMRTRVKWEGKGSREPHSFTGEMYFNLLIIRKDVGITESDRGIITSSGLWIRKGRTAGVQEGH
jgi:hypothetical protein